MFSRDFLFKHHKKRICSWGWHNGTFCKKSRILGITMNSRLTFYSNLKQSYKKFANKLNALKRIVPHLNCNQRRFIYCFYFTGQLSYILLIWIFCSRQSNHLINKFQERALRMINNDYDSSSSGFLEMSNESTSHIKNIKFLWLNYTNF